MDKLLDFIERHKVGIIATLIIHVAVFIYFQVATYKELVLFEPWDFVSAQKEAPDDIEISPDQIETPEEQMLFDNQEEISSFVKDENDARERSKEENVKYTSYSQGGNSETIEKNYEQQLKDEIRRQREEKDGKNKPAQADVEPEKTKPEDSSPGKGGAASTKGVEGKTLVSFDLSNRHPLNHNDWYIRNPGYTCGNVNGVVKVAITVDEGGRVVAATVTESQSATNCMKQKAREYALMSRFNYSSSAPSKQEGVITYRFVYRE